jgi:hypothetical protein
MKSPWDQRGASKVHDEPSRHSGDARGSSRDREIRVNWLLLAFGDGITAPCEWCAALLTWRTVTADRLNPGGPYARHNIVPSCLSCNEERGDSTTWVYTGPPRDQVYQVRSVRPTLMPARI